MLQNLIIKFIYIIFFVFSIPSQNVSKKSCHTKCTIITSGTTYWMYKGMFYNESEELLCLKSNDRICIRSCNRNTGHWTPKLVKCKISINKNNQCPDDFFEIQRLKNFPIWLKITSNSQFSIISNSKNTIDTAGCNTFLSTVCIFKSELLSNTGCINGSISLIYRQTECYGIDCIKKTFLHVNSKEYLKKYSWIRRRLLRSKLRKSPTKFFIIDYFLGSPGKRYIILINLFKKVTIVKAGLKWTSALSKHIITSTNLVKTELKTNAHLKAILLVVYNRKYLWVTKKFDIGLKCFKFSKYFHLKNASIYLIWKNKERTYSIMQVKLVSSYPREYWCEGDSIFNFKLVSTRRLKGGSTYKGFGFIIRLNVSCIRSNFSNIFCKNSYIGSNVAVQSLKNDIIRATNISDTIMVHDVRIINMKWITNVSTVYWIHIIESLKMSSNVSETIDNENLENTKMSFNSFLPIKIALKKTFKDLSINSTFLIKSAEYCYSEVLFPTNGKRKKWVQARIREMVTTKILCLNKNLQTKAVKSNPEEILRKVKIIILQSKKELVPVDIIFISNIIQPTLTNISLNLRDEGMHEGFSKWRIAYADIFSIYSIILCNDMKVIKMSAKLNDTNKKLLDSFETNIETISRISLNKIDIGEKEFRLESENENIDYEDIGVSVQISKHILKFFINPIIANVSGIALFTNNGTRKVHQKLKGSFINEHYRFLQSNHDINDFVNEPNLQLGVYLPVELLTRLTAFSDMPKTSKNLSKLIIVIKIYSNGKLFQRSTKTKRLISRKVSISLPGYSSILPMPFPLIFRTTSYGNMMSGSCQHWNHGRWKVGRLPIANKFEIRDVIVLCFLRRLTSFAFLVEPHISTDKK
ncbi:uncharacterized protein LOC108095559 [Drosophila ficusphila]|uniref:uncharacterized protein LOC108095559 n=1 Tax=Drosophila ficusphila TaxID=30025 RepID=UPI0007E5D509|nr:uncharacterized protein LOC108095559 [Drosophila ficusphila]